MKSAGCKNSVGSCERPKLIREISKRPLFLLAVFFAPGIALGRYVHLQTAYIIAAAFFTAAAVIFGVFIKRTYAGFKPQKAVTLLLAGLGALSAAALLSSNAYDKTYINVGEGMSIEGRVYSEPYVNDYKSTVCLLDDVRIGGRPAGNVKLYIDGESDVKCADVINALADVEIPKGVRNPGGFDEKLYLLSQGISYKAYADSAELKGSRGGIGIAFSDARRYLCGVIDAIFEDDTAPLAKAMLLGDTQGIDEETYTAFKDTGMAHVLAVSGLNAAILIGTVYFILKLLGAGRMLRLIAALAFVVLYTCVTGFTPSIVRAAIMAISVLIGTHLGRQGDTLNYLSLAFIVSLIIRPLDLFTAGFQLSFAAVFGMLTIGWQARRLWTKVLKGRLSRSGSALSASIGATAGTMPVLASSFGSISTLGVAINLIVIPLATAATVLVFAAALMGAVLGGAADFAAFPASLVLRAMLFIIKAASGISFAAVNTAAPSLLLVICSFIVMYITSKYFAISVKIKAVLSGALAAILIAAAVLLRFSGMYIVFLDTGQGDAAFIRTEQGGEYFIDGGRQADAREVVSFAVRSGCSHCSAFVSHTDEDHFSGIKALYHEGLLNKVYCSWQEEEEVRSAMPLAQVVSLGAGDTVWLDEHTKALVLYPYRDNAPADKNDASLVFLIEYKGTKTLFTGDITGVTETQIFATLTGIDIYKAAHHGSGQSSYRLPLSVMRPKFSVVCVGKNRYGQPDELALTNISYYSGAVYTTMEDCAIEFFIDEDITVNTYGGGE